MTELPRRLVGSFRAAFWGSLVAVAVLIAPQARALEVDFDSALIILDGYIAQQGLSTRLIGNDNDTNGLLEEDQLGMLSAILSGGSGVSCISSSRVTEITNGYNYNFPRVKTELTVSISGYGTVDIISQLASGNAQLGVALQNALTGYLTIADTATITFVNKLADDLATAYLTSINQSGQVNNVKNQINFLASDYRTYGNAPSEPNYLGPAGDIENDGQTNLAEYTVGAVRKAREQWLSDCCITAPLRLVTVQGGGLKVSGLSDTFAVTTAGGNSNKTYSWRKGTASNYTVVSTQPSFSINFLTTSSSGTYFCVVNDGTTTRTTPNLTLSVTFVALYFSQQPQSVTKNAGSSHTFSVTAAGGAGPGPYQYSWRRGTTIVGTNAPTLTLSNITAANAGNYTVRVTSNGGGDTITSQTAVLTVNTGPFGISQQPTGGRRYTGESYTFTVGTTGGSGNFQYAWTRNGNTVSTTTTPSLTLNNLSTNNGGTYRCVITDLSTSSQLTSDAALLEVAAPLTITSQPEGATVSVSEEFSFSVTTSGGFAPLSYQWKWEGINIPGQTSSTYSATAYSGFNGSYVCVVTDANGTVVTSAPAVLVVNASVEIIQDPQGGDYYVGGTAVLSVSATAGFVYTYDWLKDGVSLGLPSTNILSLSGLQLDDEGNYSVIVTKSGLGSATSATALVRVRTAPTFSAQPQGKTVYSGSDASFTVAPAGGYPPYTYQWRKGTTEIASATSATLTLQNVTAASQGNYNCLIRDEKSTQAVSSSASLLVVNRMSITAQPTGADLYAGEALNLSVTVTGGISPLTYTWKRDGSTFGAANAASISIASVDVGDKGSYTCTITDGGGENRISTAATVDVVENLAATLQPTDKLLFVGEPLSLDFAVSGGYAPLQYSWFKNGQPLDGATEASFNLSSVTEGDEAGYFCAVRDRNNRLLVSDTVTVDVADPLEVEINTASARKYVGESIELRVSVLSGEGNYHYEWRRDGAPFGAEDSEVLLINGLQLDQAGGYTCLITDTLNRGASTPLVPVDVRPLPNFSAQPQADTAAITGTARFSIAVGGGYEPYQYQWRQNGDDIEGANGAELIINDVEGLDGGSYRCVVSDDLGTEITSASANLIVVPALTFTSPPQSKAGVLGLPLSFTVDFTGGVPGYTILWYKGNTLITTGGELTFPELNTGNLGTYTCVVRDSDNNEAVSEPFTASLGEGVVIIDQPASAKRYLGETASFQVEAIGATNMLSFTWRRDGQLVGDDAPVLNIPAVEAGDTGAYSCTVSDGVNEAVSDPAVLSVAEPIVAEGLATTQYPFETTSITVPVQVSGGFGVYQYEWRRDGDLVSTDGPDLLLDALVLGDTGDYSLTVRDGYGTAQLTDVLRLRVQPVPNRHAADKSGNGALELTELLRIIQFYTSAAYHCQVGTEDGYAPFTGDIDSCLPHSADYEPIDWVVNLSELLRIIQLYNAGGYYPCLGVGEDGFCIGELPEAEGLNEGEGIVEGEGLPQ